jgi:dihydrodipicolinate synthase/N-acetylneuraminate lyase
MIKRLKAENAELKQQIAMLEGEMGEGGSVTPEERDRVMELVRSYLAAGNSC